MYKRQGLYLRGQQSEEQAAVEQQAVQEQPAEQEQTAGQTAPSSNDAETEVEEETAEVQETAPTPPTIDEVRVEEDGLTIVAGRAEPGSVISVQVDGEENTTVDVDGSGSFAAITMLDPDENARVLSLVQKERGDRSRVFGRSDFGPSYCAGCAGRACPRA